MSCLHSLLPWWLIRSSVSPSWQEQAQAHIHTHTHTLQLRTVQTVYLTWWPTAWHCKYDQCASTQRGAEMCLCLLSAWKWKLYQEMTESQKRRANSRQFLLGQWLLLCFEHQGHFRESVWSHWSTSKSGKSIKIPHRLDNIQEKASSSRPICLSFRF